MSVKEITENMIILGDSNLQRGEIRKGFGEISEMLMIYRCAIKEVSTKIEIINDEFQVKRKRNPIEYIKSRVKTTESIYKKLGKRGLEISVDSAKENLNDIAGVRVICSFVDDIYTLADILIQQDDVTLIEKKDYIENPKPNGYRSLHIVLEIPVFFSDHIERVKVEVQIRTIAMDFWASLEHKLYYKKDLLDEDIKIREELTACAEVIASTDKKMQEIRDRLESFEKS